MKKYGFKKKEEPPKIEPKSIPKEKPVVPIQSELFVTTDSMLIEKLQNHFSIKDVSLNKDTGIRTFTLNANKEEVETFLKEGKC